MVVPGSEVLTLVQCTLCMIGNASKLISQTIHFNILDIIEPSWSKFGEDSYSSVQDTLGESFQSSLTTRVEKENSSLRSSFHHKMKGEKQTPATSSRRDKQRSEFFFEEALLPSMEAGRARLSSHILPRKGRETTAGASSIPSTKDQVSTPSSTS